VKIAAISIADYCEATEGMPYDVERLYFRMILKMLAREGGLPDDDAENARIFVYDRRVYARLKAQLLAWPDAIKLKDGFLTNERVEKDVANYREKRAEAVENGRKGGLAKAEVSRKSEGSSAEVCEKSTHIPNGADSENSGLAVASPSPTPSPTPIVETVSSVEQEPAALPSTADLSDRLFEACNGSLDNPVNCMGLLNVSIPTMWINQGCDLELDILPTLRAAGKKHHGKRIRSWSYFTAMVAEAKASRERGLPTVTAGVPAAPKISAARAVLEARKAREVHA
jgi:uncharacterized protein YdaU (DUF1376 family)